uniref:Uncharacterized protein n=1 Tax=Oryza glaberrima TaxID=4538 RepID=I1PBV0_ORYGL
CLWTEGTVWRSVVMRSTRDKPRRQGKHQPTCCYSTALATKMNLKMSVAQHGLPVWPRPAACVSNYPYAQKRHQESLACCSRQSFRLILTSYDPSNTDSPFIRPSSAKFVLIVTSSNDKAILLQALCAGGIDYFVMDHLDHSSLAITRLPNMPPRVWGIRDMGLMRRDGSSCSYVVAWC